MFLTQANEGEIRFYEPYTFIAVETHVLPTIHVYGMGRMKRTSSYTVCSRVLHMKS